MKSQQQEKLNWVKCLSDALWLLSVWRDTWYFLFCPLSRDVWFVEQTETLIGIHRVSIHSILPWFGFHFSMIRFWRFDFCPRVPRTFGPFRPPKRQPCPALPCPLICAYQGPKVGSFSKGRSPVTRGVRLPPQQCSKVWAWIHVGMAQLVRETGKEIDQKLRYHGHF